jgi:hypothetical protein
MGSRQAERRTRADCKKGRQPHLSHETTDAASRGNRLSFHPVWLRSSKWTVLRRRSPPWQRRSPDSVARPLAHLRPAYSGLRRATYIPRPERRCKKPAASLPVFRSSLDFLHSL